MSNASERADARRLAVEADAAAAVAVERCVEAIANANATPTTAAEDAASAASEDVVHAEAAAVAAWERYISSGRRCTNRAKGKVSP